MLVLRTCHALYQDTAEAEGGGDAPAATKLVPEEAAAGVGVVGDAAAEADPAARKLAPEESGDARGDSVPVPAEVGVIGATEADPAARTLALVTMFAHVVVAGDAAAEVGAGAAEADPAARKLAPEESGDARDDSVPVLADVGVVDGAEADPVAEKSAPEDSGDARDDSVSVSADVGVVGDATAVDGDPVVAIASGEEAELGAATPEAVHVHPGATDICGAAGGWESAEEVGLAAEAGDESDAACEEVVSAADVGVVGDRVTFAGCVAPAVALAASMAFCCACSVVDTIGQPLPGPARFWRVTAKALKRVSTEAVLLSVGKETFTTLLFTACPAATLAFRAYDGVH